jgi:hypothetical protein
LRKYGIQQQLIRNSIIDVRPDATATPTHVVIVVETASTPIPSVTVTVSDSKIKVGAFNLQIFGTTKAGKPEVMGVLSKIISIMF